MFRRSSAQAIDSRGEKRLQLVQTVGRRVSAPKLFDPVLTGGDREQSGLRGDQEWREKCPTVRMKR